MTADETEVTLYLQSAMLNIKRLEGLASQRNKTKKYKAIKSILSLTWSRASATYHYVRAGGHPDCSVIIQKHMYDPILNWLESEIA